MKCDHGNMPFDMGQPHGPWCKQTLNMVVCICGHYGWGLVWGNHLFNRYWVNLEIKHNSCNVWSSCCNVEVCIFDYYNWGLVWDTHLTWIDLDMHIWKLIITFSNVYYCQCVPLFWVQNDFIPHYRLKNGTPIFFNCWVAITMLTLPTKKCCSYFTLELFKPMRQI